MGRRPVRRFVRLVDRLQADGIPNPISVVAAGRVVVDGRVVDNPAARVPAGASVAVRAERVLRGTQKLRVALAGSGVDPSGKACLDLGAAAGGFTAALLEAGGRVVYAVDTGYGQLRGALRQDQRVVNLERINAADLDRRLVPDVIEVMTVDLSYVPVSEALAQLDPTLFGPEASLLAMVKPTFELRLGRPAAGPAEIDAAVKLAAAGAEGAGWRVVSCLPSPVLGRGRAREVFLHATRGAPVKGFPAG
jgi:23S rRNA (cytidine1920-2'-O)/16S rRNA (cytidine1409-2'-O)-methyltransferase